MKLIQRIQHAIHQGKDLALGMMLFVLAHPAAVEAGILSRGICRPYKQLVDNELFVVISVVVGCILVIVWKLAPSGQILTRAIGLMAGLAIALNLENVLQAMTGVGLFC